MNTIQSNQMKSSECFIAASVPVCARAFWGVIRYQIWEGRLRYVPAEAGPQHPVIHFVNILLLSVVEGFPGLSHGGT